MSGMTDKGLGEVNCRDVSELVESVGNLVIYCLDGWRGQMNA